MKSRLLCASLILAAMGCKEKSDDKTPPPPPPSFSLSQSYQDLFTLGVALKSEALSGPDVPLITRNFNRITAEYEMKWAPLMKGKEYDFTAADTLVDFAAANRMQMTGHTLLWHIDTPDWVFTDDAGNAVDRETLRARIKSHIETTMKHFQGRVDNWDVVNEVLADEDGLTWRPSKFYQIYGNEDYIVDAFRFAHEADPTVELWYNDYVLENPIKLKKLLVLIRRLKAEGIPLAGVGFQGHYNLGWPGVDLIEQAFQAVIAEGLKVKVSELDVTVYSDYPNGIFEPEAAKPCDANILNLQAQRYGQLFELFRRYKGHLAHVTMWGVRDNSSWLNDLVKDRQDCPLLFDGNGEPKPSYFEALP
ncbi:MAG TPA: endo-1,4-beta-xylanase [Oligoflexus sp.]|uniref:endo-1,4-beta-xylanase n=1 Tax=Oligoflexus sp. TaxID=1971216 RepID=UPI002D7FECDF|nr:endo-1,4-beta-xylanase [Oligoflexus sp.]HET9238363.1 endo-1,4-beta-xylanase [Oligoflexus sp.]